MNERTDMGPLKLAGSTFESALKVGVTLGCAFSVNGNNTNRNDRIKTCVREAAVKGKKP